MVVEDFFRREAGLNLSGALARKEYGVAILNMSRRLHIPSSVKETASKDGAVLLDVERGICFSLNFIGLQIWGLLKKGYDQARIVDTLQKEYSIPREQLQEDVCQFMQELEASKLLIDPDEPEKVGFFRRLWRNRRSA